MAKLYSRTFEWRFDSPPEAVWPALADTARFNEAAGLPKHAIRELPQPDGSVRYFADARKGPFALAWEEVPVEWVHGQWFRHLRIFRTGPLRSLCATLILRARGKDGAIGEYTVAAEPAGLVGTAILRTGFFPAVERNFGRLAATAGEWAAGRRDRPYDVPAPPLAAEARARLDAMVARLEASPNGHGLARRLADWLAGAQETDLMRIRPFTLARAWGADRRHVVELCLQAVREGMLAMSWDLLCPRCRGAKAAAGSLDRLPRGAHCGTCNIDYERDFARNVEIAFRPAPAVRAVIAGEFCLFGPMSTPHVKVQAAVEPGESRSLQAALAPGPYRLRTVEIGGQTDIDHAGGGFPELIAEAGAVRAGTPAPPGAVRLVNRETRRRTFVIESREWVRDALTAHRATTLQAFRDLFADQVLRPGDEAGIAQVTLMFTDLRGSSALYERIGDATAYGLVREHFAWLARTVRRHGGAVVKTIGDAIMAAFSDPADAVRAALAVQDGVAAFNASRGGEALVIKLGLHMGPCILVTLNDRLDYFGSTVNMAARLQQASEGGDIVLSEAVAGDPAVAAIVDPAQLRRETRPMKGFDAPVPFRRLRPVATAAV